MITASEKTYIEEYAYLPEHLIPYVTAVSRREPFLLEDFLVYMGDNHLLFVGYPLKEPFAEKKMKTVLEEAIRLFSPQEIALIAPSISSGIGKGSHGPSDHYYRLDLSTFSIPQKIRNMLKRARQELTVKRVRAFGADHRQLVDDFLRTRLLDEATAWIFKKIPDYVFSVPTAWLFEARNRAGELIAFDVAEFGAKYWAMYMFNFTAANRHITGASDLLLSEIINQARAEKKSKINLGLGINPGVTFFKTKWGGGPFVPYTFRLYYPARTGNNRIISALRERE